MCFYFLLKEAEIIVAPQDWRIFVKVKYFDEFSHGYLFSLAEFQKCLFLDERSVF